MKKKIVSIFVSMLLFVTVVSVTGAMNIDEKLPSMTPKSASTGLAWSDDFDSYDTGQFLDGDPEDGGWEGWDNDPQFGAYVVDDPFLSEPHSVDIAGNSDLVQEFSGYTSGEWIFTAWVYVPSDLVGLSYFILLSDYADVDPGANSKWAVQMWFDPVLGIVTVDDGDQLALITDQWVEIRVEIDLEADWHQVFYDGLMLYEKAWTAGPFNEGDGILNIDAVDLFANSATSVYYDDLSLEEPQPLSCDADGPYEGLVDEEIQFYGTAAGGKPPYEYLWDFGNGDTSTVEDPVYAYSEPSVYTVNLTVTDSDQNIAWDETIATIEGLPILEIGAITGGNGITAVIKNVGNADATDVEYNIAIEGGLIIIPKTDSGDLGTIALGDSETVTFGPMGIGLGIITPMPKIKVTATCAEGSSAEKSAEARIILFFVLMQ